MLRGVKFSNNSIETVKNAEVSLGSAPKMKCLAAVGGVLLLAIVVQTWLVTRTPVSSIDSVRFVSIAQSIEAEGLLSVLRSDREQPLFPLVTCGVHHVLESIGIDRTVVWMRSVQVASVLGLLLAVPAIYLVALLMVGHLAAWIGVTVFVLLPEVARIGADGVADSWQLALVAWSVVLLGMYWKRTEDRGQKTEGRGWIFLVGAGVLMALALLVRIEAVVVIGAIGLVLLFGLVSRGVYPRASVSSRVCPRVVWFALGLAIVLAPYLVVCGTYQPGQAISRLLGRAALQETDRPIVNEVSGVGAEVDLRSTPFAEVPGLATFSVKESGKSIRRRGLGAAVVKVAEETADLFGYWVAGFALVGVWMARKRRTGPMDRFGWILAGLLFAVITWFTAKEGYVTARHLLLLLVPSVSCFGVGILATSDWVAEWLGKARGQAPRLTGVAMVLCAMTLGLAVTHRANRSAYREAGDWLAQQVQGASTEGVVFDTRGWTSLFSTMPTYQADRAKDAFADPRLKYVVVMEEELLSESDRSSTLRALLDRGARRVGRFVSPGARRSTDALIVYRCEST